MKSLCRRTLMLGGAGLLGAMAAPAGAVAALPSVGVSVVTTALPNLGSHRGITVTAACSAGRLVGGGGYLRNAASSATLPTNGLVLGGTSPSTGSTPVDTPVADGAADPSHWLTVANFTGVSEAGDQAASFALCAAGGPAHTVVRTVATTGANATQQLNPPTLTTATCAPGSRLIGGGAVTRTPDQVNDGVSVGNSGNLKPLASYPSNAAGVAAANGSSTATSWTAYGSAGIAGATDKVTAYALCSTDPSTPPVQVARVDVAGLDAQPGTTVTAAPATCPTGTRLLGGGYAVDETVGSTSGRQPQQGYHMRGSYPTSDPSGASEVANGATNPATWTALLQAGGQSLAAGSHINLHGFAMCAQAAAPPAATCSVTALRRPGPSGHAEQDVTVTDPAGLVSVGNVQVSNGQVLVGGSAGTRIDPAGTSLAGSPTSVVLTAVKTTAGTRTAWSFDVTDGAGGTTHCA